MLQKNGHEVCSIYDLGRGMDDEKIIEKAHKEKYILLTNDKDFGELIIRGKKKHKGIIILRLKDERAENKIKIVQQLLEKHSEKIPKKFLIVTEKIVRIIE